MPFEVDASVSAGALVAGKYRLETLIGRGGMGAVYSARHVLTGRRFAIKLLSRELTGDAGAEVRFMREAMLASSIQHPAIVEVYDVGRDRGVPYMVMKLLQGETLTERLARGLLSPSAVIALLMPVIDAIAAAHAHGIVHRDLKPDNVLIEREGEREHPRVLDFGISKLLGGDARRPAITRPGTIIGTPQYMAPEQVRGESGLDARCDVYSLGVILYEMATGELPFGGKDVPALLLAIADGSTVPGIRTRRPELPAELEAVVARAMEPRRELRYTDAAELGRALLALGLVRPSQLVLAQLGSRAPAAPARTPSGTQRLSSNPARLGNPLGTPAPAANTNAASPSTPVAELGARTTLPPSSTPYAGAALGAIALIALIALAVLPSRPRAPRSPAAQPVPAAAVTPARNSPQPPAQRDALAAPRVRSSIELVAPPAPRVVLPPAVTPAQPAPIVSSPTEPQREHERRRRSMRAARPARDAAVAASEEPAPRRSLKARVDMPSLTSEILDPFE